MKKTLKQRLVSGLLTTVFAVSLLPVSAFAVDPNCKHETLVKGLCQTESCKAQFAAKVGDTLYTDLAKAIADAQKLEDKAVVLLNDVSGAELDLQDAYLVIPGDGTEDGTVTAAITLKDTTITGKHAGQLIYNTGSLVLNHVTAANTNEEGKFVVYSVGTVKSEDSKIPDPVELNVLGGQFDGKYAIAMKQSTVQLGRTSTPAEKEGEEPVLGPVAVLNGKAADFMAEAGGMIEVMADLGADTTYTVEAAAPGAVAHMGIDGTTVTPVGKWFVGVNADTVSGFDSENGIWTVAAVIPEDAVKLSAAEFTYDGNSHMPEVSVVIGETTLVAGTDYDVKVEPETTVEAGTYTITVTGKGSYSGTRTAQFTIQKAEPSVITATAQLQLPEGGYSYTGAAHTPAVVVKDDKGGVIDAANYEVAYANNTNAGTATVTVTAKDTAAVKFEKIETTFAIKAAEVEPTVTVAAPEGGFVFSGAPMTPAVTVKVGEADLPVGEYTVAYKDNIAVGTATVTITDKDGGNYSFKAVSAAFAIQAGAQTALEITGKVETLTYGAEPVQLGTSGGSGDGAVTWELTKGGDIASIDASGKLTITGAGTVAVKATKAASGGYEAASAEWSVDVQPAVLTVSGVTASDKAYDGKTTVAITAVQLAGILNNDDVKVNVEGLTGELNAAGVGVYEAVKPGNMSLAGAAAAKYKLTAPTEPVAAKVTVKKADLPAGLDSIEVKLPVSSTKVEVTGLGSGMPKDAGALTYLNRNQETVQGNKVIVLKWGVDANGTLTSEIASGAGGDKITYTVAVNSENYNPATVKVIVTLGAEAVDTSKVTVTPASTSLTYNGADQKPAMTVKYNNVTMKEGTDFDVTYPSDSKNVGDKEVKVAFKGSYTGTAAAKYTITKAKVTVSGGSVSDKTYDGGKTATVNVGTVSGLVKGDDVKVTAKGLFADANSGSGKKVSVTYSLSGGAAGNYELGNPNVTLTGRIYAISANSLYNRLGSLTTANANSSKAQTLKDVIYLCNLALGDGGLASGERSSITALRDDAENMQDRVTAAAAAASTESIKATEKVTKENVKLSDQPALTKAQADLNTALTTYSGNYTTGEKKEIETDKTRVADALAVVTKVDSANKLITALPTDYTNVTTQTMEAITAANNAYSGLSDYGKSLIDKAQVEKLTAAMETTEGVIPTDAPEGTMKPNINGIDKDGDKDSPETIKFPTWIILIAVVLAAAAGGGYYWYYKKQQEEEDEEFFY